MPSQPLFKLGFFGMALVLFGACKWAVAQEPVDAPPVVVSRSCAKLDFNLASLAAPVRADMAVGIDESGKPVSALPLADVANGALLAAVRSHVMTCKFAPALRQGKAVAGTARMLFQFDAAPAAAPLTRRAGIVDIRECAPKADDYPKASLMLNESGVTKISLTVDPKGRLTAFGVVRSSGFLRLDFAALVKLAGCRFRPGTTPDGEPTSATFEVEYVWKLD